MKPAINYISEIKQILASVRQQAYAAVNFAMVEAYWFIGRRIVEEEQHGTARAEYGKYVIKELSQALTTEFGKGFSERSILQFRQFYQMFPQTTEIPRALLAELQLTENNDIIIWQTPSAKFHSQNFTYTLWNYLKNIH